jgi:hypothetical protein
MKDHSPKRAPRGAIRAALERAVYGGGPFNPTAVTRLIHLLQAEGDYAGALRARDHTMRRHGDELPPEPW